MSCSVSEVAGVGLSEVRLLVTQTLCLYQGLTPSLLTDHPVIMGTKLYTLQ